MASGDLADLSQTPELGVGQCIQVRSKQGGGKGVVGPSKQAVRHGVMAVTLELMCRRCQSALVALGCVFIKNRPENHPWPCWNLTVATSDKVQGCGFLVPSKL